VGTARPFSVTKPFGAWSPLATSYDIKAKNTLRELSHHSCHRDSFMCTLQRISNPTLKVRGFCWDLSNQEAVRTKLLPNYVNNAHKAVQNILKICILNSGMQLHLSPKFQTNRSIF
jgi:hypothetical protein